MLQSMFPFDIFGFINGIFILVFVIVIVFLIIVIIIVYKLFHSNVDDVKKGSVNIYRKLPTQSHNASVEISKETIKEKLVEDKEVNTCKYCGEKIGDSAQFCPFCGSDLSKNG